MVTPLLIRRVLAEEITVLQRRLPGAIDRIGLAVGVLRGAWGPQEPPAFLSHPAYAVLLGQEEAAAGTESAA